MPFPPPSLIDADDGLEHISSIFGEDTTTTTTTTTSTTATTTITTTTPTTTRIIQTVKILIPAINKGLSLVLNK